MEESAVTRRPAAPCLIDRRREIAGKDLYPDRILRYSPCDVQNAISSCRGLLTGGRWQSASCQEAEWLDFIRADSYPRVKITSARR